MTISLIVATNMDGAIGNNNQLIYYEPNDLRRFRQCTTNPNPNIKNYLLMGRKTFESLPKVLPNRTHVVLTSDTNYKVDHKDAIVVHSLEQVINHYNSGEQEKELFVIGGQSLYEQSIQYVDKIYLTYFIDEGKKADTFFNLKWLNDFTTISVENNWSEKYQCWYNFIELERKQ